MSSPDVWEKLIDTFASQKTKCCLYFTSKGQQCQYKPQIFGSKLRLNYNRQVKPLCSGQTFTLRALDEPSEALRIIYCAATSPLAASKLPLSFVAWNNDVVIQ